jgi:threonylcarbamoyladenosine tRNA methylthiotransferase MtaB
LTKVAFHTLGCKLNFAETSSIARKFTDNGYERVDFNENADIYIINTCSVTKKADKKSEQFIKKARKQNPDAQIVVMGCYAQLQTDKIASIEGVDLILGSNEKFRIMDYLKERKKNSPPEIHSFNIENTAAYYPSFSYGDRTRSFLKVQDGCDYHCSYCTIPLARGNSRNQSIESIVSEAEQIGQTEVKEIILTGVNIGDFGKTTGESFLDLIKALDQLEGIERIRISSIEPNLLSNEIVDFVKHSKKILPHFHIPLQSGCNAVLAQMRRRYSRELFRDRVDYIRQEIPDAFIGVDVIVGFPGEDVEKYNETLEFLEKLDASFYHVFSYSQRPNTPAAEMGNQIPKQIITQRSKELQELAEQKERAFYKKNLNSKRPVLFENYQKDNQMFGFTDNYIKIETPYNSKLTEQIAQVKLKNINDKGNVTGDILSSITQEK